MGILPDYSFNGTVFYADTPRPQSVERWQAVVRYTAAFSMAFYAYVLFAMAVKVKHNAISKSKRRVLFFLFGNLFFNILVLVWFICMVSLSFSWKTCRVFGKLGGPTYAVSNMFIYFLLLERANLSIKRMTIRKTDYVVRFCIFFTRIVVYYLLPVVTMGGYLFFQGKLYYQEQNCIQDANHIITWLFTISDTGLSLCLLYLFIHPFLFRRDADELINETLGADKIRKLAKENLFWSTVAVLSTAIIVGIFASRATIMTVRDDKLEYQYWRPQDWFNVTLDMQINTFCILMIFPKAWKPNTGLPLLSERRSRISPFSSRYSKKPQTLPKTGRGKSNMVIASLPSGRSAASASTNSANSEI